MSLAVVVALCVGISSLLYLCCPIPVQVHEETLPRDPDDVQDHSRSGWVLPLCTSLEIVMQPTPEFACVQDIVHAVMLAQPIVLAIKLKAGTNLGCQTDRTCNMFRMNLQLIR